VPDRAARMQQDALEMLPKPADPSSCVWTYVHRDCQYLPAANTPCHPPFGRSHGRGRRFESCSAHQNIPKTEGFLRRAGRGLAAVADQQDSNRTATAGGPGARPVQDAQPGPSAPRKRGRARPAGESLSELGDHEDRRAAYGSLVFRPRWISRRRAARSSRGILSTGRAPP